MWLQDRVLAREILPQRLNGPRSPALKTTTHLGSFDHVLLSHRHRRSTLITGTGHAYADRPTKIISNMNNKIHRRAPSLTFCSLSCYLRGCSSHADASTHFVNEL